MYTQKFQLDVVIREGGIVCISIFRYHVIWKYIYHVVCLHPSPGDRGHLVEIVDPRSWCDAIPWRQWRSDSTTGNWTVRCKSNYSGRYTLFWCQSPWASQIWWAKPEHKWPVQISWWRKPKMVTETEIRRKMMNWKRIFLRNFNWTVKSGKLAWFYYSAGVLEKLKWLDNRCTFEIFSNLPNLANG